MCLDWLLVIGDGFFGDVCQCFYGAADKVVIRFWLKRELVPVVVVDKPAAVAEDPAVAKPQLIPKLIGDRFKKRP